jgi:hypothetical protein
MDSRQPQPTERRTSIVTLTLIAEVLSGETVVTPGGCVDMATARGLEAFTWDTWFDQLELLMRADEAAETAVEGAAVDILAPVPE